MFGRGKGSQLEKVGKYALYHKYLYCLITWRGKTKTKKRYFQTSKGRSPIGINIETQTLQPTFYCTSAWTTLYTSVSGFRIHSNYFYSSSRLRIAPSSGACIWLMKLQKHHLKFRKKLILNKSYTSLYFYIRQTVQ